MKKSTKKTYRVRNWREYNEALVNRGSLTLWIDERVAATWVNTELSGKPGATDYYSDAAILTVLTLKEVFHLKLRQAEGFTASVLSMMGLELEVPDYSTLSRRRKRLDVSLDAVGSDEAVTVLVDATGVKIYGEGEWKVRQHGASKRRTWRKLHFGVDHDSQQIAAAVVTTNNIGDGEVLGDVLDQIDGEIDRVVGDGAYDTEACYRAINQREAAAVIPPRRGARIWKHGNATGDRLARDENLRRIRKVGRAEWKRQSGYHQRSLAETAMYRYKTIFGDRLGERVFESQCAEVFIKCAALNRMTRLGMPDSYIVTG